MAGIDIERLRSDLISDIGSAAPFIPAAMGDVLDIQCADDSEIISIARQNGYNLDDYGYSDDPCKENY